MQFVHPEFLWLLTLLVVPVIIHLFHFRRFKTLYFPSLKFIKYIEQENKSTKKLKNLLVLIARLLTLVFLVLCFAQPFLGTNENQSAGKNVLAIYIDNSFSMSAKGTEGELLSEAKELTRRLLNEAKPETHILISTNKLDGIEQRLVNKVEALEYLEKIEFSPIRRDLNQVLNWQKEFLDRENAQNVKLAARQYVIISDFQKNQFKTEGIKIDNKAKYYPIQILPQDLSNLYIDSVWFSSPIHKKGEPNELFVRVQNKSENDLVNIELEIEAGTQHRSVFMDLQANKSTVSNFQFTNQTSGIIEGKASINDKQLFWDDDFYFSYTVAENAGVLILNGEDASDAVNRVYSLESFYKVKSISELSFTRDELKNIDLIILNGLNQISSGLAEELKEFKNQGGSLFIFPGTKIKMDEYNRFFDGISFPRISGVKADGNKIDKLTYQDPFFKNVFEKESQKLNLPSIKKSYDLLNFEQKAIFPLVTLRNGSPLLIRTSENSYLFSSALNAEFSTFSDNALFPTVLLRAGEFSKRNLPLYATIGKESKLLIYEELSEEQPLKLTQNNFEFIPVISKNGFSTNISISGAEAIEKLKAGNYKIFSESVIGVIALNYDRLESEISYKIKNEIEVELEKIGVKNLNFSTVENGQSLTVVDLDKPQEYWRICLVLALLFILSEMALLRFMK